MTPSEFKDKFFVSVARKDGLVEVRVGITLKAIVQLSDESKIEEAKELAKNDIIQGVYGGIKEEFRGLLNDLLMFSQPQVNGEQEYYEARKGLIELMQ